MAQQFRAVILAGGMGTRLRPYTITIPKPLVPVGERPILEIVLRQLRRAGVNRVTMAVNHQADLLMAYFGDGSRYEIAIDYSREDQPLGTIAPLRLIPDLPENFLVMNGDILTDLDFRRFWERHLRSGALASVSSYRRTVTVDFGVLEVADNGRLVGFREKPKLDHMVSMGIYAFRRDVLRYVPANRPFGFDQLMLALLENKIEVRCEPHEGTWLDIGRAEDCESAQGLLPQLTNGG